MVSESLQAAMNALRENPKPTAQLIEKLNLLTQDEIGRLYCWIITQYLSNSALTCFKELFKKPEKRSFLLDFLSTHIIENNELFVELFSLLKEQELLLVIEQLVNKVVEQSEFTAYCHHILLYFSAQLYGKQNAEAPLNQWHLKSYATKWSLQLFHAPECIVHLAQTNSVAYTWLTMSQYTESLKHRINAVLHGIELTAEHAQEISLIWLHYFHKKPERLYSLFTQFQALKTSESSIAGRNIVLLQQACWVHIRGNAPYKEKELLALLKTPYSALIAKDKMPAHYYHKALFLAERKEEFSLTSTADEVLNIAQHSITDSTADNWNKAQRWLEKQTLSAQGQFIRSLIARSTNPFFARKVMDFIANNASITQLETEFKEDELSWLLRHGSPEQRTYWLDVTEQSVARGNIDIGLLYNKLSEEVSLLNQLVNMELFTKPTGFAKLFITIHLQQEGCDTEEARTRLFAKISAYNLSTEQLLVLIETIGEPQIRSLLTILLLSKEHYLEKIRGDSPLNNLTTLSPTPQRLNGLIQLIDINTLTKELINNLTPEASFSLLCSVTHFHHLTPEQTRLLVANIPQPKALQYWLMHYSTLPNAHRLLAHFMNSAELTIYNEFKNFNTKQKKWFVRYLIDNLEYFGRCKILQEAEQEEYLTQAINKYIHGYCDAHYIEFINSLLERLLNKNHLFSNEATKLLIMLHDDPKFEELTQNTAYLINHHLKLQAQTGSTDVFFDGAFVNIPKMLHTILLKPKYPEVKKSNSLFAHLIIPILPAEDNPSVTVDDTHPLIAELANSVNSITAFNYFLIHFKGNILSLKPLIHFYLTLYAQKSPPKALSVHLSHTCTLITRGELPFAVRNSIYEALLDYPSLYNEHISYCMFLFNARKTIQYFGFKGTKEGYQQVIHLCTLALTKLHPRVHQELIQVANKALLEAKTELAFAEERHFFIRLIQFIKRCWIYGWSGLFKPNPPVYVMPLTNIAPIKTLKNSLNTHKLIAVQPDLATLLAELKEKITLSTLDQFYCALNEWNQLRKTTPELEKRYEIHSLFERILAISDKDSKVNDWLKMHQSPLIKNSFSLLEHLLAKDQKDKAIILLTFIQEHYPYFKAIATELDNTALPRLTVDETNITMKKSILPDPTQTWDWMDPLSFFRRGVADSKHTQQPLKIEYSP